METIDSLIIGAGVVGLAVARHLAGKGRQVVIIEKEPHIGQGISSRNSEVIHAGIYYPPGSLKAKTCLSGRDWLYRYAEERGVPYRKTGKLIVASSEEEVSALESIRRNGAACGVEELRFLSDKEVEQCEPQLQSHAALFSPNSGIIDSHQLMLCFLADAESHGAVLSLSSRFVRAQIGGGGFTAVIADSDDHEETFHCREIVNSAGLDAIPIASRLEGLQSNHIPHAHYSRGCYFTLSGRPPFSHLIYPVPEQYGLGIHATLDLAGRVRFGPDHSWIDEIDYQVPPDSAERFALAIRRYYPGLRDGTLAPGYVGIRPKISSPSPDGPDKDKILQDFWLQGPEAHGIAGLVNLFGIESPGLTASPALAELVWQALNAS